MAHVRRSLGLSPPVSTDGDGRSAVLKAPGKLAQNPTGARSTGRVAPLAIPSGTSTPAGGVIKQPGRGPVPRQTGKS
jgi:hypothetical protein